MPSYTKADIRQSVYRSALNMAGTAANATVDTILSSDDAIIGKLYEDRNITLTDGGTISFTGSALTFTENLNLIINSRIAGGSPLVINLGSSTRNLTTSGNMVYAVVNRTLGTAVVTADASTLPAVSNANDEIVLIAKRQDTSGSLGKVYLRNGIILYAGQNTNDLIPSINNTYNLGSASLKWQDLYLSDITIAGNNISASNTNGNIVLAPNGTGYNYIGYINSVGNYPNMGNGNGPAVGNNFAGLGEADFWSTAYSNTIGFNFYQQTGASSEMLIATLGTGGSTFYNTLGSSVPNGTNALSAVSGTGDLTYASFGSTSFLQNNQALFIGTTNSSSLAFRTNGITALTLDSSQNATFAADILSPTIIGTINLANLQVAGNSLSASNANGELRLSGNGTGYVYAGLENNASTYPIVNTGVAVGNNFIGQNDIDFFNTYTGAGTAFNFYQQTGAGAATLLMNISSGGAVALTDLTIVGNVIEATNNNGPLVLTAKGTGYAYLNVAGTVNNSATYPGFASGAFAVGWNFSNGSQETDFFNTTTAAAKSFSFYQQTGVSSATELMKLDPTNGMTLSIPLYATSGGTGNGSYATGDLLYASSSTALSRLAIGPNGTFLGVNLGGITWTSGDFVASQITATGSDEISNVRTRTTGTSVGAGGVAVSTRIDGTITSTTLTQVSADAATLTVSSGGKPVMVGLMSETSGAVSFIEVSGGITGSVAIFRGGTQLCEYQIEGNNDSAFIIPMSTISIIDFPAAGGSAAYTVQASVSNSIGSIQFFNMAIYAYEL